MSASNENNPAIGGVFNGLSFFLVQRLPMRSSFVQQIRDNGGRIVKLEVQANYIIADHFRHDCPPGSLSYTFISSALKDGTLPDPEDHVAGPPLGTIRNVGSTAVPARTVRTEFTAEDDLFLWLWVERMRAVGGMVKGNEIYKQLEAYNPRHTFQSWRDRYIKRLMFSPPAGVNSNVAANAPGQEGRKPVEERGSFGLLEYVALLTRTKDILCISEGGTADAAWETWARNWQERPDHTPHTPEEWQRYWKAKVLPVYRERNGKEGKTLEKRSQSDQNHVDSQIVKAKSLNGEGANDPDDGARKTPARLSPRKRKLEDPTQMANATSGQKKHKTDAIDSFEDEHEIDKQQSAIEPPAISLPQTLDSDVQSIEPPNDDEDKHQKSAEMLIMLPGERGSKEFLQGREQLDEPGPLGIPPSYADRSVDQQIRRSSSEATAARGVGNEARRQEPASLVSTSEAPRAATQQSQRRSLDEESDVIEEEPKEQGDVIISTHLVEDGEVEDGLPGEEVIDIDGGDVRISEADLTSQQPQRKAQLLTRSPSSATLGATSSTLNEGEQPRRGKQGDTLASEVSKVSAPIPTSSLQETDGMKSNLRWPFSSQQTLQPKPQVKSISQPSQSQEFETQIPSSTLRAQNDNDDAEMFTTQQPTPQSAKYPTIRDYVGNVVTDEISTGLYFTSRPELDNRGRGQVEKNGDVPAGHSKYYPTGEDQPFEHEIGIETPIDLDLAEPDGGFDFFSPAQSIASQPTHKYVRRSPSASKVGLANFEDIAEVRHGRDDETGAEEPEEQEFIVVSSTSSSSRYTSPDPPSPSSNDRKGDRAQTLETQDIVDAETQQPDLSMPLPPDFDEQIGEPHSHPMITPVMPSKPAQRPQMARPHVLSRPSDSGTHSTPVTAERSRPAKQIQSQQRLNLSQTEKLDDEDIDTFVTNMAVRYNITDEAHIINALKCTSIRGELALIVLLEEKAGRGFPRDVPGIWSEDEDRAAESGDARTLRRLTEKHGWEECLARMEFLKEWRDGQEG